MPIVARTAIIQQIFFYLRVLGLFILSSLNILLLLLNQSFCEICGCYHSCCLLNIILFHFQTSITVGLKAGIKDRVINFHSEIYENSVLEKLEKNGGKKGLQIYKITFVYSIPTRRQVREVLIRKSNRIYINSINKDDGNHKNHTKYSE